MAVAAIDFTAVKNYLAFNQVLSPDRAVKRLPQQRTLR